MAQNPWSIPKGVVGNERKALKAIFDAMKKAQQSIPPEALAQLQFGNVDAFMKMIDWSKIDLSFDEVRNLIEQQTVLSAQDVFSPTQITSNLVFNRIDEKAVAWAREHSSELVRNITQEFRESIRSTISDGLAGNLTVPQMASRIKQNLPLLPRDRGAVDNFRQRNFERFMQGGMSEEKARAKADAKAERYANKLTRRRAQTIARTEMVASSNAGKEAGWEAGVEGGYIDNDSQKEWIAEPNACEICKPLDGMVIPWQAEFPDLGTTPPAHPNCRCTVAMLPPDYAESEWRDTPTESPAYDQETTAVDPNEPAVATDTGFEPSEYNDFQEIDVSDPKVKDAVQHYTSAGYLEMNGYLRAGAGNEWQFNSNVSERINVLQAELNKGSIPKPLEFIRGQQFFNGAELGDFFDSDNATLIRNVRDNRGFLTGDVETFSLKSLVGQEWKSDGFLSTSTITQSRNPYRPYNYRSTPFQMHILAPAGTKGMAVSATENEFLLPYGTNFRIEKTEIIKNQAHIFLKVISQ